jgi:hypothetical protein
MRYKMNICYVVEGIIKTEDELLAELAIILKDLSK